MSQLSEIASTSWQALIKKNHLNAKSMSRKGLVGQLFRGFGSFCNPAGPSTQYLRFLVFKVIPFMVAGTRVLIYWLFGPSGFCDVFLGCSRPTARTNDQILTYPEGARTPAFTVVGPTNFQDTVLGTTILKYYWPLDALG